MKEKQEKRLFWENYQGEKCCFCTFNSRVTKFWLSWEEAIKPTTIRTHKEELMKKYWKNYPWTSKASLWWFMRAVGKWIPKERAVIRWEVTQEEMFSEDYALWNAYQWPKCSFSTYMIRKWSLPFEKAIRKRDDNIWIPKRHCDARIERNKSDYLIEVTYKPEEALVFHRMYRYKITDLENKIYSEENYSTLKELEAKLTKIKEEYKVFLSYNPIQPWLHY